MQSPSSDRIRRIYLCKSPQVSMFVFLYLEQGVSPRAIARIEWGTGAVLFVEFPQLPWESLQERVRRDIEAFSAQYGGSFSTINIPEGCSPEMLMEWIHLEREARGMGHSASIGKDLKNC